MKRTVTLLLFLLTLLAGYAQNPFAAYGYKPKTATLSHGRFDEFHDKDRIVEIGSVMFDTKTNKIVGKVEQAVTDSAVEVQTVSRFISIDPHAERYYSISPYVYCNNNPVSCIDPSGMDWYRHNESGNYMWKEGHDDLDYYTNMGSSISIQLGEDLYFNAYQNAGIMANQAVDAFDLISSSAKLQNQFLGKGSPLSEASKSELFNGLVNQETSKIGRSIGQALLTAEAVASGVNALGALGNLVLGIGNGVKAGIQTANGIGITGFTGHGVNRAIGSLGRKGVSPQAIQDALKNPLKVGNVITDQFGRQSQRFIGQFGEVVINPQTGKIISVNPTSTNKSLKLLKQLGR